MPNYKQAPKLYHNKSNFNSKNYYNLPQELMDCAFQQLDGKCGNQIKLLTVLLGTLGDGSFGVSEKWICDRTGMIQQTYSTARKGLIERGWVYVEDGNLYVLPAMIRSGGIHYPPNATKEEKEKIRIDTISKCVNEIKQQYKKEQTQYDIVKQTQCEIVEQGQCDIEYNKINNKNKKNINNKESDIVGEITQAEANRIIDKEMITPTLLLTTTGKYFRIKG